MKSLLTSDLARNGHPSNHTYRTLAMLRAYFDETGHVGTSKTVMLCGVIASPDNWDKFDIAWKNQLAVPEVDFFHAYECEHGEGNFAGLSKGLRESLFGVLGRNW